MAPVDGKISRRGFFGVLGAVALAAVVARGSHPSMSPSPVPRPGTYGAIERSPHAFWRSQVAGPGRPLTLEDFDIGAASARRRAVVTRS